MNYFVFIQALASNPNMMPPEGSNLEAALLSPEALHHFFSNIPRALDIPIQRGQTPGPTDEGHKPRTQSKWSPGSGLMKPMGP